jgi:hypothetical protein
MRLYTLAALAALAALPLSAPAQHSRERDRERSRERERDWGRGDYVQRIDTTVAFDRTGAVDLSNMSGDIVVRAWDRDEVRVNAFSEHGTLRFDVTSSRLTLDVRPRGGDMGDTRYELTVPSGTRVVMRSVSGDLSASGMRGEVEAHTTSGDVKITDIGARVTAESVSGDVEAREITGNLRVSSVSGDLTLERIVGDVEAETVSGEVKLDDVQSKYVRAKTTSGEVDFRGTIDGDGRYELGSHSGNVHLTLPADVGATVSLETFSGEIESDFPMQLQPGAQMGQQKRITFKIGDGSARITATSFSGNIEIERGGRRRDRDNGEG